MAPISAGNRVSPGERKEKGAISRDARESYVRAEVPFPRYPVARGSSRSRRAITTKFTVRT